MQMNKWVQLTELGNWSHVYEEAESKSLEAVPMP